MFDSHKLSKILFYVITVGIFFVLFAPLLIHNKFFFPFIGPRNVLFRMAVELMFFAWLLLIQLNPSFKPNWKHWDKLVWLVVAFFIINVISTIFGIGQYRSFWSNYERMSGLFHFGHLLAFFLVLISVFKQKRDWHIFLVFSIFISTLMSLLSFAQWLGVPYLLSSSGGTRLTGTAGNATFLAAYLIFNLFFVLYFWAKESRFSIKTFAASFLVFDIWLVFTSIFAKLSPSADWGSLSFLKLPLLNETFKRAFASGETFSDKDISTAGIFLGMFVLFQVVIFGAWFFRKYQHAVRGLLTLIFVFYSFIIWNTQTRGAILGVIAGFIFLAIVSLIFKVEKNFKRISIAFLIFIILTPFILVAAKETPLVKSSGTLNRLASISLTDITTETRLLTWKAGWKGITESPKSFLIGYGPENYYYVFNKNFPNEIYKDAGSRIWFDRAHNIIFDVGATTGVVGLGIYLSILILATYSLYRNYKNNHSISASFILIALLIAYFIQNLFVFDTLLTDIMFYFVLAFIVFLSTDLSKPEGVDEETVEEVNYQPINYIYASIVVIVFVAGIFSINVQTLKANNYIYQGLVAVNFNSDYEKAFDFLKLGIDESLPGRFEARQQIANLVNKISRLPDVPPEKATGMINYVAEELKKSVDEEPKNIRHYMFLSTFYNATASFNRSNPQKVINLLEPKGIALSPTRPQIYYEIGQAYAFLGNFDKSYEYFQKGIALAPGVLSDQFNVLTVAIVFGQIELADEIYNRMIEEYEWEPTVQQFERLVLLYGRINEVGRMLQIQEEIVELDPTATHYAQLAELYEKNNNLQKAREASAKAIELDPSLDTKN